MISEQDNYASEATADPTVSFTAAHTDGCKRVTVRAEVRIVGVLVRVMRVGILRIKVRP